MNSSGKEIRKLMKKNGFVIVRANKHFLWEHKKYGCRMFTSISASRRSTIHRTKKEMTQLLDRYEA